MHGPGVRQTTVDRYTWRDGRYGPIILMSIYIETRGTGPDLVLLHGWGLHGGIWKPVARELATEFRVTIVDLPGYGRSRVPAGDYSLDAVADAVSEVTPDKASWIGWSLGGMTALQLAFARPERVERLVLVATTPRFVAAPDWPWGMDSTEFDTFAASLVQNRNETLHRFLALQVRDSDNAQRTLRRMRKLLTNRQGPSQQTLQQSLGVLRNTDLRDQIRHIQIPTLVVHGDRDHVVRPDAGELLQRLLPDADLHLIEHAGHAPFVSHQQAFLEIVDDFLL